MPDRPHLVLGLRFFDGTAAETVNAGLGGGLVVVPSAPVLVEIEHDAATLDALVHADVVVSDSGLMVLMWRLLGRGRLTRVSGLEYIQLLLESPAVRASPPVFWIMPTIDTRDRTRAWLQTKGIPCSDAYCYVAPKYGPGELQDSDLLDAIRTCRPKQIVIALGGGTQERLGLFLKKNLDYRPGIHCIGAAIGFLTGDQVRIPTWGDYFYLGWLFRCFSQPTRFVPRYWRARKLIAMMWRYGEHLPQPASARRQEND